MSRTFKDVPYKLRWEHVTRTLQHKSIVYSYDAESESIIALVDTNDEFSYYEFVHSDRVPAYYHARSVPSWWTRLKMNVPQRRAGRLWERQVLLSDLEETDPPGVGRHPKIYYW